MSHQVSLDHDVIRISRYWETRKIYINDKSIFTNDISLILDRGPILGHMLLHEQL